MTDYVADTTKSLKTPDGQLVVKAITPYSVALEVNRIVVTTATSTISTLMGTSVDTVATLKALYLVPELDTATIRFNNGAATATTARLPVSGIVLPVTKTLANTIQLMVASGTAAVSVVELG